MATWVLHSIVALLTLTGLFGLKVTFGLLYNISEAKRIGLPYVVLPFSPMDAAWLLLQPLLLSLFQLLPSKWTEPWLMIMLIDQAWHNGYAPFEKMKANTFIAATPGGCVLFTCDPAVNTQICRDGIFGKPKALMQILNVFGPALTASDGQEGRLYRRTAAPFFTEQNLHRIWRLSVDSSHHVLSALKSPEREYSKLRKILVKYTVNLWNQLAFETHPEYGKELLSLEAAPAGYTFSYTESILESSNNLLAYFTIPSFVLEYVNPKACLAKRDLLRHMSDMTAKKKRELREKISYDDKSSLSMLDFIVGAHLKARVSSDLPYTSEAVLGNIFILNIAASDSTATILTFALYILACRLQLQEAVQQDIERIFGQDPPHVWNYKDHFNALINSTVGAIIYETLRTFTVIPVVPRETNRDSAFVPLIVDSITYNLPAGMLCLSNTSATNRNPKYWGASFTSESQNQHPGSQYEYEESQPFPLSNFKPDRWLVKGNEGKLALLEPEPGSFMSFSEGARNCLGRRLAVVEVCATIAALLRNNTVKLAVPEGSTEAEAQAKAEWAISGGVKYGLNLMSPESIPIKIEERKAT